MCACGFASVRTREDANENVANERNESNDRWAACRQHSAARERVPIPVIQVVALRVAQLIND